MLDCPALTPARLKAIADDVRRVCNLALPGRAGDRRRSAGQRVAARSAAACRYVVGAIYEARPECYR